jgi:hypothetical protein
MGGMADAGEPAAATWNCRTVQPPQECPATAPTDGETCTGFVNCEYDDTTCTCAGMGGGMGGGGMMTTRAWSCGDGTMTIPSGFPMMSDASAPGMPPMMSDDASVPGMPSMMMPQPPASDAGTP